MRAAIARHATIVRSSGRTGNRTPAPETPVPASASDGCAALLGSAIALSALYFERNATCPETRLHVLSDPDLLGNLTGVVRDVPLSSFDAAFLGLPPRWLAAAALVLDHATIAQAVPRPTAIGGVALDQALVTAMHLAALSPPFDHIVPHLEALARVGGDDEP